MVTLTVLAIFLAAIILTALVLVVAFGLPVLDVAIACGIITLAVLAIKAIINLFKKK